jgi:hypothetical protein
MNQFANNPAREAVEVECLKRNKHKSKFLTHMTWKPLWNPSKGWHPALRRWRSDEIVEKKESVK